MTDFAANRIQVNDLNKYMVKQRLDRTVKLLAGDCWLLNCVDDVDALLFLECDRELTALAPAAAKTVQITSPVRSLRLPLEGESLHATNHLSEALEASSLDPRAEAGLLESIWQMAEPTVLVNNRNNRIVFGNESSAIESYSGITLDQWTSQYADISPLWQGYEANLANNLDFILKGDVMSHCTYEAWHLQGFRATFEATWSPQRFFRMSCRLVTMHGFTPLADDHSNTLPA